MLPHRTLCTYQFVTLTSPPGIPRAFNTLPFSGSGEFDFRTAGRGGEFDRSYTTSEEKMLSDLADKILRS